MCAREKNDSWPVLLLWLRPSKYSAVIGHTAISIPVRSSCQVASGRAPRAAPGALRARSFSCVVIPVAIAPCSFLEHLGVRTALLAHDAPCRADDRARVAQRAQRQRLVPTSGQGRLPRERDDVVDHLLV